jgi:phosphatidyl-myo-inositol dimannoside synthase
MTTDAYGGHGGIALYNRDLIEAFATMPEVSQIDVVPRTKRFEVDKEEIPTKASFFQDVIGNRWKFISKSVLLGLKRPDIVVCGHVNLLPIAAPIAWLARRPLVLVVYGIDVWQDQGAFTKFLLRAVKRIWSISAITRDRMNDWAKLPLDRYALLPNAIHLERYGDGPRVVELLAKYSIPSDATMILTVARLAGQERYKGIDEVLGALPELLVAHPNLYYVVAGDGNDRERLENIAEEVGVKERVRFVGFVTEPEKLSWLRSANAFVMPGRGEGFGFVFLEALAAGTPAVGSVLDGSREALLDGALGALADPRKESSVVNALSIALSTPRGVPRGLAHFSFARFSQRLVAVVRQTEARFSPTTKDAP